MRRDFTIDCAGIALAATLDLPAVAREGAAALLIVSGGNEIRCGAHGGQAGLAAAVAASGHPVLRFDAPGIGDSMGENGGFRSRAPALYAALAAFRAELGEATPIVLLGNCDAASLIVLSGARANRILLANPWVIEPAQATTAKGGAVSQGEDRPATPPAAAIMARYRARLRNPGGLIADLLRGRIALGKLARGLAVLSRTGSSGGLAAELGSALAACTAPVELLIAQKDGTALAFLSAWKGGAYADARRRPDLTLHALDSASHSFADPDARVWLQERVLAALAAASRN